MKLGLHNIYWTHTLLTVMGKIMTFFYQKKNNPMTYACWYINKSV